MAPPVAGLPRRLGLDALRPDHRLLAMTVFVLHADCNQNDILRNRMDGMFRTTTMIHIQNQGV
jgi:hypothetical protein